MSASQNFIEGMSILKKYTAQETIIGVCENSSICIEKLFPISEEDLYKLQLIDWDAYVTKNETSIAYFHKLKYMDY